MEFIAIPKKSIKEQLSIYNVNESDLVVCERRNKYTNESMDSFDGKSYYYHPISDRYFLDHNNIIYCAQKYIDNTTVLVPIRPNISTIGRVK